MFKTKQLSLVLTGVVLVRLLTLPGYPVLDRTEARYAYITQHRKWSDTWRGLPWVTGTALTLVLVVPWYALAEIRTPGFLAGRDRNSRGSG